MIEVTQEEFEQIVSQAIDDIPDKYFEHINNVVFVIEDEPTIEQRQKLRLHPHQSLFGLYEGIPITKRAGNYNMVLPDKITIFKHPIESTCGSHEELIAQVNKTVWHEVAHYYGLDHLQIDKLEH